MGTFVFRARASLCRTKLEECLNQVDDIVRAVYQGQYAPFVEGQARIRDSGIVSRASARLLHPAGARLFKSIHYQLSKRYIPVA